MKVVVLDLKCKKFYNNLRNSVWNRSFSALKDQFKWKCPFLDWFSATVMSVASGCCWLNIDVALIFLIRLNGLRILEFLFILVQFGWSNLLEIDSFWTLFIEIKTWDLNNRKVMKAILIRWGYWHIPRGHRGHSEVDLGQIRKYVISD